MPRNVFALFACLCVLGFASPNAVGQSPRLAWANDFARLESGLSFMKSSPDTIRVVLRTGLDPKSFERKDVTTSWMVAKTELPEMLKRNRCLARGLAGKNDGTEVIIVYPRDFPISERETVIKHLVSSAKPKDETLSLVLVKPGEPAATVRNVKQAGDLSGLLAEAIPKEGAPCRYAAFEQTVVLFLAPQEAEKKRSHAVAAFSDGYKAWVRDLKEADQKAGANAAAKKIASNTAEFFVLLNRQNLLDDRTQSYEALWTYGIAPAITADAKDATAALQLEQFGTNFVAAQNKDKCTVTVSTMPKPGATIHYAKAADAQRHVFTPHSLPTINTFEVERATYSFRVLRGGTQTGGVDGIKCTDPTQLVVIDEIP